MRRGTNFYVNAVVREEMNLFQAPPGGMAEFKACYVGRENGQSTPEEPLGYPLLAEKYDGRAVIARSYLSVWNLSLIFLTLFLLSGGLDSVLVYFISY